MTTKLVCRLLDAQNQLLGWVEHEPRIRGDGQLRASFPVVVRIETPGIVDSVSIHWADVNVETRVSFVVYGVAPVLARGDVIQIYNYDDPMITVGPIPGPLPAVTISTPVVVGIPVGAMGATGMA